MTKVAIIILNWNKPDLTIETVNSVLKINHSNFDYQIFLVDNGSSDNSLSIFQKEFSSNKKIKIIGNNANLGFVGGNNSAAKHILKLDFDQVFIFCGGRTFVKDHGDVAAERFNQEGTHQRRAS
jgi:GT2 family glycosyltransferase